MSAPDLKETQLAVIGAGPGGYPAAFHAADLGMRVTLIDREAHPGGVCLYRGCIPSKALLHAAGVIGLAREASEIGIRFAAPDVDLDRLRDWKQSVVGELTGGLGQLTRARNIDYVQGEARFVDAHTLAIRLPEGGEQRLRFEQALIATGSTPVRPGLLPDSERVMDSTSALEVPEIPETLLVMGGGYIGLELGQVYAALGARVDVVEMQASLLSGVDADLTRVLSGRLERQFNAIRLSCRVVGMEPVAEGLRVRFEDSDGDVKTQTYARVLAAVGRRPVTQGLELETAGVRVTDQGFVAVDAQRRTSNPRVWAIGDVAGQPMLAHKATHEGRAAVEAMRDGKAHYDPRAIPAIVFTDPEIAWCGLTEAEARQQGLDIRVGVFPWAASGRAATLGRKHGTTKVIAARDSGRVLGVGIAGFGAGELIAEAVLAIEMGAVAEDIARTVHPHPSLSETFMEAAERVMGPSTHVYQRR